MGYLQFVDKSTLKYQESRPFQRQIRNDAVEQFLHLYKKNKDRQEEYGVKAPFGYEIECQVLQDHSTPGKNQFSIQDENDYLFEDDAKSQFDVVVEYCTFQIEIVPKRPFYSFIGGLAMLEHMSHVRSQMMSRCRHKDFISWSNVNPFVATPEFMYDKYRIKPDQCLVGGQKPV
jgi:hypothetical protein